MAAPLRGSPRSNASILSVSSEESEIAQSSDELLPESLAELEGTVRRLGTVG